MPLFKMKKSSLKRINRYCLEIYIQVCLSLIILKLKVYILFLINIFVTVKRSSERFMADLESCWQTSIRLEGLCRIIKNHANKYFHIYINYCENQIHLVKTLKKLKSDTKFNEIINYLQCQPACQSLSLDSFVMLPMQRITRLPLLVDAVLKYLETDNKEYELCLDTLKALNNVNEMPIKLYLFLIFSLNNTFLLGCMRM